MAIHLHALKLLFKFHNELSDNFIESADAKLMPLVQKQVIKVIKLQ